MDLNFYGSPLDQSHAVALLKKNAFYLREDPDLKMSKSYSHVGGVSSGSGVDPRRTYLDQDQVCQHLIYIIRFLRFQLEL